MSESKLSKPAAKPAEQPAPQQPAEQPGFFRAASSWVGEKAHGLGTAIRSATGGEADAGPSGRGNEGIVPSAGRALASIPETFSEGVKSLTGPGKDKEGLIELP